MDILIHVFSRKDYFKQVILLEYLRFLCEICLRKEIKILKLTFRVG